MWRAFRKKRAQLPLNNDGGFADIQEMKNLFPVNAEGDPGIQKLRNCFL